MIQLFLIGLFREPYNYRERYRAPMQSSRAVNHLLDSPAEC